MANKNLTAAKKAKNDEFYTRLEDIEKEVNKYWLPHLGGNPDLFKDKIVLFNCDDPIDSKFWRYFGVKFKQMKLKKIISTHYEMDNKPSYKLEYDGSIPFDDFQDICSNPDTWDQYRIPLQGNGDFQSDECIEILKTVDFVITNPPFSLFRNYIGQLIKYNKKFLIIGNFNAVTYKEFFPLIKDNKIWLGYNWVKEFIIPGGKTQKFGNICWFTNLDVRKRHEKLELVCKYNENDYPKYDNYNAIEVSKTVDIPCDYDGVMGVPISFLDKYNPDQFEIVGFTGSWDETDKVKELKTSTENRHEPILQGEHIYRRILIRRK